MGNQSSFTNCHFEHYNSHTTEFFHYDLTERNHKSEYFDFCLNLTCDQLKVQQCTMEQIEKILKKKKINGAKMYNFMPQLNDDESRSLWSKLEYLNISFTKTPISSWSLKDYLQLAPGIVDLTLHTSEYLEIDAEVWDLIADLKMNRINLERVDVRHLSLNHLRKIMENTDKLLFKDKILAMVLYDDELTSIYLKKKICLLNLDTKDIPVDNHIVVDNFIRLLGSNVTLTLDPDIDNEGILKQIPQTTTIKALNLRDLTYYDVKIGFTDTIHIWKYDLDVLYQYIENNPNITKVTSCYDAVSFSDHCKFMDRIAKLDRSIDINIQYIETKEQKRERKQAAMMQHGELSLGYLTQTDIIEYLSQAFTKELDSYETCDLFRTLSRIALDRVYKIVSQFDSKLKSVALDNLCRRYNTAIEGKNLLSVTNIDDCQRSTLTIKMEIDSIVFDNLSFNEVKEIKDCIVAIFQLN